MSSVVSICNQALWKVGAPAITSLEESTPQARACKQVYDSCRDSLLEVYPWRFALKRYSFGAPLSEAPEFEFDYKYELPSDCLRVFDVYGYDNADWNIEENCLVTSIESPQMRYIKKCEDVSQLSPAFVRCLALAIAAEISPKLKESPNSRAVFIEELGIEVSRAFKIGAIEGFAEEYQTGNESWVSEGR